LGNAWDTVASISIGSLFATSFSGGFSRHGNDAEYGTRGTRT
jgi:hypothetical protein